MKGYAEPIKMVIVKEFYVVLLTSRFSCKDLILIINLLGTLIDWLIDWSIDSSHA